jgi:hypothetical protein
MKDKWKIRRLLRYGSKLNGENFNTKDEAIKAAQKDIGDIGQNGQIHFISDKEKTVYYDVYEEYD